MHVLVNYKPRECNQAAHALAAVGSEIVGETDPILDSLPHCIQVTVA
jgi:hypothetical protein